MKSYYWQRMTTGSVHGGYRVVYEYQVCRDHRFNQVYYTGLSRADYIPA